MTPIWAFILGTFFGSFTTIFALALAMAASRGDEQ